MGETCFFLGGGGVRNLSVFFFGGGGGGGGEVSLQPLLHLCTGVSFTYSLSTSTTSV